MQYVGKSCMFSRVRTASDPVLIRWAYGLLGNLWEKGFKVVPLEPEDLAG